MNKYAKTIKKLEKNQSIWLITGVAGFIGSHLLEKLLKLNQKVIGLDNFSTGYEKNLEEVKKNVTKEQWLNFQFINGDIRKIKDCRRAMHYTIKEIKYGQKAKEEILPVQYVLHQAALGSVPRSIEDPILTNESNVVGFLNMLVAARDAKVQSFTYAASSSTYGDNEILPKKEENIGKSLSSYAVTKYINELYADVFWLNYGFKSIGLRYFNVYGPRQDPKGSYAAVIPKWTNEIINDKAIIINGDGTTSRDFTYIDNVVQANILCAMNTFEEAENQIYNIAIGKSITLNEIATIIHNEVKENKENKLKIKYQNFRKGDIKHSLADISKAKNLLNYNPTHEIKDGIRQTVKWFINNEFKKSAKCEHDQEL